MSYVYKRMILLARPFFSYFLPRTEQEAKHWAKESARNGKKRREENEIYKFNET